MTNAAAKALSTMIGIDANDLAEMRRSNRKLARMPRFRVPNGVTAWLIQSLLALSQIGGDRKLRRVGISAEQRAVIVDGTAVKLRLLRPAGPVRGIVLDIHGGGWAIGNARMDDTLNAALIQACGVAVVSVDYRLASTAPLQALMEDCLAAARWVLDDGLPEYRNLPAVVIGESAGGHLAAATLLGLKRWPDLLRRVVGTVLYYGVYDLAGTPSVREAGPEALVLHGPGLMKGMQRLTSGMSNAERREPPLSPLYGDLQGLPPALMFVGDIDPLRDDTLQLAERWGAAGDVELEILPEAPHGFIQFGSSMASKAQARCHAWVRSRLDQAIG